MFLCHIFLKVVVPIPLCLQIFQADVTVKLPALARDQTGLSRSSLFRFSPNLVIMTLIWLGGWFCNMLQFPFPFPRISLTMTLWTLKQGGRSLYRGPSWDQLSHRKYTSPLHTIHLSSFSAFSLMLHICFPHVDCPFLQVARARSVFWKYLCFHNIKPQWVSGSKFPLFLVWESIAYVANPSYINPTFFKREIEGSPSNPMMFTNPPLCQTKKI